MKTAILLSAAATVYAAATAWAQPIDLSKMKPELDRAQSILNDWPGLGRYREDNTKLPAPAAAEKRVVFLGDSITENWGRGRTVFFAGKPYVNRGIGGQTTPQMLIRFRQDVIALKPAVVVILGGTNDIAGNTGPMTLQATEDNIASMAQLAGANAIAVVLATLLPVWDDLRPPPERGRRPPEKVVTLNAWIREFAERHEIVLLDYYSSMLDAAGAPRRDWTNDGLHPNEAGYKIMAFAAEQAIAAALAR